MKSKYLILNFLIIFCLICSTAIAEREETFWGKGMQVKDGDTVVIAPEAGGKFFTCRLYGIDAPERDHGRKTGQPYGKEAHRELEWLLLGERVEVTKTGNKAGSIEVCMFKQKGIDINLEMVKKGHAWAYKQYLKEPYASEYIEAESEARAEKLGLWQDNDPKPPWEFREAQGSGK